MKVPVSSRFWSFSVCSVICSAFVKTAVLVKVTEDTPFFFWLFLSFDSADFTSFANCISPDPLFKVSANMSILLSRLYIFFALVRFFFCILSCILLNIFTGLIFFKLCSSGTWTIFINLLGIDSSFTFRIFYMLFLKC